MCIFDFIVCADSKCLCKAKRQVLLGYWDEQYLILALKEPTLRTVRTAEYDIKQEMTKSSKRSVAWLGVWSRERGSLAVGAGLRKPSWNRWYLFILIILRAPAHKISSLPVDHAALEVGPDIWCLLTFKLWQWLFNPIHWSLISNSIVLVCLGRYNNFLCLLGSLSEDLKSWKPDLGDHHEIAEVDHLPIFFQQLYFEHLDANRNWVKQ